MHLSDTSKYNKHHFQPEVEEIERAKEIVKLFEAEPNNSSIISDIYGFVDEPVYKGAKRFLESID